METPVIKYNLRERGRKFTGKERNFNIRSIMDAVNGPVCQERVNNRDMLGYYGHQTRIIAGMSPEEIKYDTRTGKVFVSEPAFVTTYLRAHEDGTIEHKARFLETEAGKRAAAIYSSGAGGFSSAINEKVPEFFGLDFVFQPNYSGNRGYAMDSADGSVVAAHVYEDMMDMTFDSLVELAYHEQISGIQHLLDSAERDRARSIRVIEHLREENEQLLSMLASGGKSVALDSSFERPMILSSGAADRMKKDAAAFNSAHLLQPVLPVAAEDPAISRIKSRTLSYTGGR